VPVLSLDRKDARNSSTIHQEGIKEALKVRICIAQVIAGIAVAISSVEAIYEEGV